MFFTHHPIANDTTPTLPVPFAPESLARVTELPAPPRLPRLVLIHGASDGRSGRRSTRVVSVVLARPSNPPTLPPPGSAACRHAA